MQQPVYEKKAIKGAVMKVYPRKRHPECKCHRTHGSGTYYLGLEQCLVCRKLMYPNRLRTKVLQKGVWKPQTFRWSSRFERTQGRLFMVMEKVYDKPNQAGQE